MGRFIAEREKLHSNLLGLRVQQGNWIADGSIRQLAAGLLAKSSGPGSIEWPRRGCRKRAPSSSRLHAEYDRRILLGCLGLRGCLGARSSFARMAAEEWRPQRYATASASAKGGK